MQPIQKPRIVIEDLPLQEPLSAEEMAGIFGAGLFRPTLERLETREVLSAIATSTLGGVAASFSLNNRVLTETSGPHVGIQSTNAQGLFQSKDAAGHQVVFEEVQNYLYEFTPKGWIGIGHADQVAQNSASALLFDQGAALFAATGVPANTAAGHQYLGQVQGLFQGKDSAGNPVAYKLAGGTLSLDLGHTWKAVPGMVGVTQVVVDGSGQLYARLYTSTVYTVTGTSTAHLATGVTVMAIDSAGEAVMLQGSTGYFYVDGGISVSGGVITSNGAVPQYAIDSQGNLYTLLDRALSVAATSYGPTQTLGTGVTQMVMTAAGGVAVLDGPHSFAFYGGIIGSSGSSPNVTYALDGAGNLYQLQSGTVYRSAATGLQPISGNDVRQLLAAEGGTLFALATNGTVYRYPGSGSVWQPVSGRDVLQIVVDGSGTLFARSSNGIVYRYPGSGNVWQPVSGNDVRQLVVDGAGAVYAFTTEGIVFRYPGTGSAWAPVSGNDVIQLQVSFNGTLFALSSNGTVYRYPGSGSAWTPVSGNDVTQLVVDLTGTPFALSRNGTVYRYPGSGSAWTPVSGNDVRQLVVQGNGVLFALSSNGTVYAYPGSGSAWTPVSGNDVTHVSVDGGGHLYALGKGGTVYVYPGSGTVWTAVGNNGVVLADTTITFQATAVNAQGAHAVYRVGNGQFALAGYMHGSLAVDANGGLSLATDQQVLGLTSGTSAGTALANDALKYLGQIVGKGPGRGQCAVLVEQVLQDEGMQTDQNHIPPGMTPQAYADYDYVWGTLAYYQSAFSEANYDSKSIEGSLKNVGPGDVIQYRNAQFSDGSFASHHTSMVLRNFGDGRLEVIQQNAPEGAPVTTEIINVNSMTGTIWIYHPVPVDFGSGLAMLLADLGQKINPFGFGW